MPPAPPIVTAGKAVAKKLHSSNESKGEIQYRISWITGGFMLVFGGILDGIQLFFTVTGFLIPASYIATYLYITVLPLWFYILSVPLFGGRSAGLKMASAFGGAVVELVPVMDAVPAMTASIAGVIIASRMEDRMKHAVRKEEPSGPPARLIARTVNISRGPKVTAPEADNNSEEDAREAA
jgi:hypothetical protein